MEFPHQEILLTNLYLDPENARHGTLSDQTEILNWMLTSKDQKNKTFKLAEDIAENGLSPIEEILVVPLEDKDDKYLVAEGNRRVSALKVLANPSLCGDTEFRDKYKKIVNSAKFKVPNRIDCVVAQGVAEAQHWIRLRHTGELGGIGTVQWGGIETERFVARIGRKGSNARALQVLDYARERKLVTEDQASGFPITNLTRLLNDPDVRERLGVDLMNNKIIGVVSEATLQKTLKPLLRDIADGEITVTDIKKKRQRTKYATQIARSTGANVFKRIDTPYIVGGEILPGAAGKQTKKRQGGRLLADRKVLIPRGFGLSISQHRLNKIYTELKQIDAIEHTNAVAVLFRVFMELCVEVYGEKVGLNIHSNDKLAKKVGAALQHMREKNLLDGNQAKAVNTALSSPHSILSIDTFHAYVHNKNLQPIAKDLKTVWDNIAPFFEAMDGKI